MDDVHLNYLYNRLNLDYKLDYYLEKQFNIRELSKKKYDYLINCFEKKISLTNQELLYLKNKFTINESKMKRYASRRNRELELEKRINIALAK